MILSRAAEVGETLALNKEKRILDMVLGITNSYKFNGTAKNTYDAVGGAGAWKNLLAGNPLEDWSNIDAAENLFGSIVDPATGEAVLVDPDTVLVMPQKRHQAHRLFYASEISYADTDKSTMSAIPNPFSKYALVSSRIAFGRLTTAAVANPESVWLIGNFKKAFAYMENWPITVAQSSAGSEADFTQDVVVRYKASERGTPAVLNPRYVVKCTE